MVELIVGTAAIAALSLPLWGAVDIGNDPVPRKRVEKFAARHAVQVTVDNGQQIIGYLTTTRRWRSFGLATGLVFSVAWFLPNFNFNTIYLFAGWFAGALVAELRLAPPPHGATRAALAAPRVSGSYISLGARLWVPLSLVLCLSFGVATGALLWTVAGLAVAIAVWAIQRHVLRRPQPAATPDQVAADDAIRSRSLHVLTGAGVALIGYCVLAQIGGNLVGAVIVPLVGLAIAHSNKRVVRVR